MKRIIEKTIDEFGRLDILVNNAGILELGTIENSSLEQYDRVMNTNMRYVLKSLLKVGSTHPMIWPISVITLFEFWKISSYDF